MDKVTFLAQLKRALAQLPTKDRQDVIMDFEQHFVDGMSAGKSEEEVAAMLGNPRDIARQYISGIPAPEPATAQGVGRGILASIGLLLFDAMIALPIIAALFAVWASLWAVALSLFAAGLACFVAPIIQGFPVWFSIFAGLSLLGLSGLIGIGMFFVSKYFFIALKGYGIAHYRIIKGGIQG